MLKILLVIGGYPSRYAAPLDSTELFDTNLGGGGWTTGAALPNQMKGLRAANIDNRVYIFGIFDILIKFYLFYIERIQLYLHIQFLQEVMTEAVIMTLSWSDATSDSYTETGTMTQARSDHAVSVVQSGEYSQWCQ